MKFKARIDSRVSNLSSQAKVLAAGDMRRDRSLVVWAIREGRQAAHAVDKFLIGIDHAAAVRRNQVAVSAWQCRIVPPPLAGEGVGRRPPGGGIRVASRAMVRASS